jgi:hypothetical protein
MNYSSDKIVLKLASVSLEHYKRGPVLPITMLNRVAKIVAEAKVHAKEIRAEAREYWRPSEDRRCRCGHTFKEHSAANCEHEVGGNCMRHTCAGPCNHTYSATNSRGHRKTCRCPGFRERPGNKVRP